MENVSKEQNLVDQFQIGTLSIYAKNGKMLVIKHLSSSLTLLHCTHTERDTFVIVPKDFWPHFLHFTILISPHSRSVCMVILFLLFNGPYLMAPILSWVYGSRVSQILLP